MRWHIKLVRRNGKNVYIAYSYEMNDSCDGLLVYDESAETITIEKLSLGADEFDTKGVFEHIYRSLRKNELTDKKQVICIG
jgi:hypothetical protein